LDIAFVVTTTTVEKSNGVERERKREDMTEKRKRMSRRSHG
jgi:hypothetical protein